MLSGELSGDTAARGCRSRGYRSRDLEKTVLDRELPGDIDARGYRSRGHRRGIWKRQRRIESFRGIQLQGAIEVGAIEVGIWKRLCWIESFRGI